MKRTRKDGLHAHVDVIAQDCDGRFDYGYVVHARQRENEAGFLFRVLSELWPLDPEPWQEPEAEIDAGSGSLRVYYRTDEGYRLAGACTCSEAECPDDYWQRDHAAEAMGY